MGIFYIDIEISKPSARPRFNKVKKIMVDTGSEATWIPNHILRQLKIPIRKKDQPFIMANGQSITRDIGYAVIRYGEFETIDEVVFAREGDLPLLGARTLEGFNARVDARRKRLVASGPIPVAAT